MKWKHPPIIKVYEALGAVADGRVELLNENEGKVWSSTRNKSYQITFDKEQSAIMANDNGSYWRGYLGYPSIAFLLKIGVLEYREKLAETLRGVAWKDINQKHKNDFEKTLEEILSKISPEERKGLERYAQTLDKQIEEMDLSLLGSKVFPPKGY